MIITNHSPLNLVLGFDRISSLNCSASFESSYRSSSNRLRYYSSIPKEALIEEFFQNIDSKLMTISSECHNSNDSRSQYRDEVIKLLHDRKKKGPLSEQELIEIQSIIEDLTMKYDDKNIYSTAPNLIKRLIRKDKPSAKDYLKSRLQDKDDLEMLFYLDQYTLETIILHVLGTVFHSLQESSAARVSTLVEQLDSFVRVQVRLLKSRKNVTKPSNEEGVKEDVSEVKSDKKNKGKRGSNKLEMYAIGANLVAFLVERELISLSHQ